MVSLGDIIEKESSFLIVPWSPGPFVFLTSTIAVVNHDVEAGDTIVVLQYAGGTAIAATIFHDARRCRWF
jgi:hypothetical protein